MVASAGQSSHANMRSEEFIKGDESMDGCCLRGKFHGMTWSTPMGSTWMMFYFFKQSNEPENALRQSHRRRTQTRCSEYPSLVNLIIFKIPVRKLRNHGNIKR